MKVYINRHEPIRFMAGMRLQAISKALEARKNKEKGVASYWFRKAKFWRKQLQQATS